MIKKTFKLVFVVLLSVVLLGGGVFWGIRIQKEKNNEETKEILKVVEDESAVVEMVEDASKSVVTVSINKDVIDVFSLDKKNIEQDVGTGFVISNDGLIVTNKHVVSDTEASYKAVIGEETFEVKEIYRDPINDLAILKIDSTNLVSVEMGDSDQLKVGQTVIAIGTALGEFRSTVTKGVISGLGRGITASGVGVASEKLENIIQTDAAINSGNSGGPLFNLAGQVIGVNVAVSQNGQNIGFALPINLVKSSVDNFRNTGEFDRPYLGVVYQTVTEELAQANNLPVGDYIQSVVEDSPAQKAGIEVRDVVTEIDGEKVTGDDEVSIAKIINQRKIGDEISVKLVRDGKEIEVKVELEKKE